MRAHYFPKLDATNYNDAFRYKKHVSQPPLQLIIIMSDVHLKTLKLILQRNKSPDDMKQDLTMVCCGYKRGS